jgi:hypothetical protein
MQNYNYSLSDLDSLIPWEREIYIMMLIDDIKKQREEQQRQQRG